MIIGLEIDTHLPPKQIASSCIVSLLQAKEIVGIAVWTLKACLSQRRTFGQCFIQHMKEERELTGRKLLAT